MSILYVLDKKDFKNLVSILDRYDEKLKDWKTHLKIDGKNIESANIEQASWLAYYDEIKIELKTLVDFMDMKIKEIRGKVTNMILNKSSEIHNEKTRERLIDCDPDYIKMYQISLEVKEIYSLADSIVNQFIQRGYILTNLVRIRTSDIQDVTLYIDGK